jgi:hypothetical protein
MRPLHADDVRPGDDPYVPGGQNSQVVGSALEFDVPPGSAYEPTGQLTIPLQADDVRPGDDPNVPGGHIPQVVGSFVSKDTAPALA